MGIRDFRARAEIRRGHARQVAQVESAVNALSQYFLTGEHALDKVPPNVLDQVNKGHLEVLRGAVDGSREELAISHDLFKNARNIDSLINEHLQKVLGAAGGQAKHSLDQARDEALREFNSILNIIKMAQAARALSIDQQIAQLKQVNATARSRIRKVSGYARGASLARVGGVPLRFLARYGKSLAPAVDAWEKEVTGKLDQAQQLLERNRAKLRGRGDIAQITRDANEAFQQALAAIQQDLNAVSRDFQGMQAPSLNLDQIDIQTARGVMHAIVTQLNDHVGGILNCLAVSEALSLDLGKDGASVQEMVKEMEPVTKRLRARLARNQAA
ncbi:hypothetical protein J4460_08020 [Candidatus Woesearchaeota archaeon]|nr:hypothetical protein [Candidatus Woesearchaeota archaeon]HIH38312.1 hypothetical protein [Candidatus Woesearchaeota archaeon]HIH48450.1 hypothetical protein [Candidatus Woesearchaeota archaeon]HIJ03296.1 hypothetical protein [Candidatus Woesearchaeota archaeon]